MPLDATQREFLTKNLGIQANRGFLEVTGKVYDSLLSGSVTSYLEQEKEIIRQIDELRKFPSASALVLEMEGAVAKMQEDVKKAGREGGKETIDNSTKAIKELNEKAKTVLGNPDFYRDLEVAEKDLVKMKNDPQRGHVATEIQTAEKDLADARKLGGQGKFVEAKNKLTTGAAACTNGLQYELDYASVMVVKAKAARIVGTMSKLYTDPKTAPAYTKKIEISAAKADPPTRNYGTAITEMQDVIDEITNTMKGAYVTAEPAGLATLKQRQTTLASKSKDGTTIVDEDVQKVADGRTKISDSITAGKFPVAMLVAKTELPKLITGATKIADRRIAFDTQRETTVNDIGTLGGYKELASQVGAMNRLVEKADGLATRKAMRFEDAIAQLKEISATATLMTKVYDDCKAYAEKRLMAEDALEYLKKKPAARRGMIDSQVSYIDKLMTEAQQSTGAFDPKKALASGLDIEDKGLAQTDWAHARVTVEQALAAIKAAEKLADGMSGSAEMSGRAGAADNAQKINRLAADMRKQAEEIGKQPSGDKAAEVIGRLTTALDEAVRLAALEGQTPAAQEQIKAAADLLAQAQKIQSQYAQFVLDKQAADGRQTKVTGAGKDHLEPKTDESAKLLTEAKDSADKFEWDKANESLRKALALITEAEEADKEQAKYELALNPLETAVKTLTNPLKDRVAEMLEKAREPAKAFDYVHATRFLQNAEAQLAGEEVKRLALAGTDGVALEQQLEKMLKAVGGEEMFAKATDNPSGPRAIKNGPDLLDDLVKNLPDTVDPKVIIAIGKKRFNIDLTISALSRPGGNIVEDKDALPGAVEPVDLRDISQRTKSGKKIYEMLALTPEQSKDNPSLKKVMRENALDIKVDPTTGERNITLASGGYYRSSDNLTSMSGRPGESMQKFGSKQKGYKKDREGKIQKSFFGNPIEAEMLPEPESPEFAPANEDDVDYFDFANVHETGHAVDDRMGFMKGRANNPAFGGWIVHGSDIETIAKQVAAKYGGSNAGILEQYVQDLMIGAKVEPPAVGPREQIAVNAACELINEWFDIATKTSPWWNHGDSTKIALNDGRVYHEAYKSTWVSYPLSERSKGITGYQFRAPGEWFAELYAAYHLDKLKPGHPARKWLSSLSL
jgi:hypothetical protein